MDFHIPEAVRSLHDFKFFRNVDADLTKQLANLEVQRNKKIQQQLLESEPKPDFFSAPVDKQQEQHFTIGDVQPEFIPVKEVN